MDEAITTEFIKSSETKNAQDLTKLIEMVIDIRFQTDFTLMSSPVEVQELYDKYRNRPADESNVEIRTLLDLAAYVKIIINDEHGLTLKTTNGDPYNICITRLVDLLTLHSNVDEQYTCQDESITATMNKEVWKNLLKANPWLVAAVLIRMIPGYHIMDIAINKFNGKGEINEARSTD